MQRFTYDDVQIQMRRREEGLRRAQLNGTAFEYRPKRRFSFALPWRRSRTETPRLPEIGGVDAVTH